MNAFNCIAEALSCRGNDLGTKPAFVFLRDGEDDAVSISFAKLEIRAKSIAAFLQASIGKGERALLLYPPGIEYIETFFACLYAGVVAVPAFPPGPMQPNRGMKRLAAICADVLPGAVLTTAALSRLVEAGIKNLSAGNIPCLATDLIGDDQAGHFKETPIESDELAFIQYSSGATGNPKGVMISNDNIVAFEAMLQQAMGLGPDSVCVSWLPFFHDACMIGYILQTPFTGSTSIMMAPEHFLQKPVRWLKAFGKYRATVGGGPNFGYELCARKIKEPEKAGLRLESWKTAWNGAEPVYGETMRRFARAFQSCGFREEAFQTNYGLAEATLLISGGVGTARYGELHLEKTALQRNLAVPAATGGQEYTGSGQVYPDQKVVIVDPLTGGRCRPDEIGEIWCAGPNVALGYWNRPQETAETFKARLADTGAGPFLRTGDLGFLHEEQLYITGRLKDLIIIHGSNHYPQDIERTVERSHPALRPGCGAVFPVSAGGGERIVIVQECRPELLEKTDHQEIFKAIRKAVADEHQLPVFAVMLLGPQTIPKTTSGKIRRKACREAFLNHTLKTVAAWRRPEKPPESASETRISLAEIQTRLVQLMARETGLTTADIDPQATFNELGLGSVEAVTLSGEIEEWLGRSLAPTLFYDYPTVAALSGFLGRENPPAAPAVAGGEKIMGAKHVAIVGMACRFPGADSLEEFWALLKAGKDAVTEVPSDRWDIQAYFDPDLQARGKINSKWGGFLRRIDQFDPALFNISPREAAAMDPQQRLLLEVAFEAMVDAGQPLAGVKGGKTGVFVGSSQMEYSWYQFSDPRQVNSYSAVGTALGIAANRISYVFDLKGPSLAVDTICSSSLLAVHLACESLRRGECRTALAGGANLILTPNSSLGLSKLGLLSQSGRCRSFDAAADGIVRGEGVGVVFLKMLAAALADNDRIYAVIRGGAVNQDGRSNGITAPNGPAQEELLREALRRSGIRPADIHYIEAHGTGTVLGDPIEARAVGNVLREGRLVDRPCYLGSVKTNIGHSESAGGIASLIKVALALKHRQLPASLHFHKPNPYIPFEELGLKVPTSLLPWPAEEPATAGVSSLAFGGTNVHVVLSAAPRPPECRPGVDRPGPPFLLFLSAHCSLALDEVVAGYLRFITGLEDGGRLYDLCHAAAHRRSHFPRHRLALVFQDREEVCAQLRAFLNRCARPGLVLDRELRGSHGYADAGQDAITGSPTGDRAMAERQQTAAEEYVAGGSAARPDLFVHPGAWIDLPSYPLQRGSYWVTRAGRPLTWAQIQAGFSNGSGQAGAVSDSGTCSATPEDLERSGRDESAPLSPAAGNHQPADAQHRRMAVEALVRQKIEVLLGHPAGGIDLHLQFHQLGLDSLAAMELRNDLEQVFEKEIPMEIILEGISVMGLIELIADAEHDSSRTCKQT